MTGLQSLKRIVELEDRIKELEAERDAALDCVRQLREYVMHRGYGDQGPVEYGNQRGCASNVTVKRIGTPWPPCDCGLDAALAAAARVLGETK